MIVPDQSETYIAPHAHDTLKPDPMLEAGLPLPRALQREFPPELIATPIEDLDKFYENKMVCLIIFKFLSHLSNLLIEQFLCVHCILHNYLFSLTKFNYKFHL